MEYSTIKNKRRTAHAPSLKKNPLLCIVRTDIFHTHFYNLRLNLKYFFYKNNI